jgi:hypothetical protein
MEIFSVGIFLLNCFMKKILSLFSMLLVIGTSISNAQTEKTVPPPPPPKVNITKFKAPVLNEAGKSNNEFMKRNPTVANIWQEENITIVKLKLGKKEKYKLENEIEKKTFVDKYGEPPLNPPKVVNVKVYKPVPPPPPKPSTVSQ